MNYSIVENGVVTNVAVADSPLGENWILGNYGIGATTTDNITFIPIADEPVVTTDPEINSEISCLAFRNRFTLTEKIALYEAAKTDVSVQIYLDDVQAASFIDLSHANTQSSVHELETGGLIDAGRAVIILTPLPTAP
tara:strand:+ start:399 stop:812 length:414 start_codon:yes stop_codon:yes gene_type:complete